MNAQMYWQLFLTTGSPEAYLLYNEAMQREAQSHVYDDSGAGAAGDRLQ